MAGETVRAKWVSDHVFILQDRNQFPIVMNQPNGVNGADLLPLSLIGCAAYDVIGILMKQRQRVARMEVSAESLREDEPPWRYKQIRILYQFWGQDLAPEKIRKAIDLSERKYCSIYATLRQIIDIHSEFEIEDVF